MKNYIVLNGKKIKLTEEQVAEMQKSFGVGEVKLSSIPTGETFKIGKHEFVVLEHSKDTTAVILKDLLYTSEKFGSSNNYNNSNADKLCNCFGKEIEHIIGDDNLIEHTVDLTADDGLKDYKFVKRKMALITANNYRRYVETLDKHKLDYWWWTATAYSTPTHGYEYAVKCVSPSGSINYINCINRGNYGVRPFCILKSNILVSK